MEKVLFKEEQRFRQWWLWLIIVFTLLAVIVPLINALTKAHTQLHSSGTARLVLYGVLAVLFLVAVLILLVFIKLKIKITANAIYIAYLPFQRKWKKFPIQEIEKYEVRKYQAIREFGGYGMKRRRKVGQAYTISGNIGLQLYLKNGKKILIGTQKKQAIEYAMKKLLGDVELLAKAKLKAPKEKKFQLGSKTKKFLIIILIEILAAIIILSLIQISK